MTSATTATDSNAALANTSRALGACHQLASGGKSGVRGGAPVTGVALTWSTR